MKTDLFFNILIVVVIIALIFAIREHAKKIEALIEHQRDITNSKDNTVNAPVNLNTEINPIGFKLS